MTTNNHPAHGPVSLDRLHQIRETLSKAAAQSDGGNLGYAMADAVKVIDSAIAAFGAEPVAYLYSASFERGHVEGELTDAPGCDMPVYTAPSATVSFPGELSIFEAAIDICRKSDAIDEHAWNHGVLAVMSAFRACLAAMLQAGNFRENQNSSTNNCREISETSTNEHGIEMHALLKHIEGMEVSVDVSTYDADAGHRYFGTVTEISELETAKNGFILLVQDAKPNFKRAGNSPVTPDGYVLVPNRLTAENGAKGVLSGEFSETKFINCPECFGDDECETCDGSGRIEITVPVTWTTIKAIWAKGVEHFSAAPQQEVK